MSKNPNVGAAVAAVKQALAGELVAVESPLLATNPSVYHRTPEACVRSIDAAGLLVTPLHTRAVEACVEADKYARKGYLVHQAFSGCAAIGREAIALEEAKKPKERWEVKCADDARTQWFVVGNGDFPTKGSCNQLLGPLYEPQARAVAKALNECDK